MSRILVSILFLSLIATSSLYAQSGMVLLGQLTQSGTAISTEVPMNQEYLRIHEQTGQTVYHHQPLTEEKLASCAPRFREQVEFIRKDKEIQYMAKLVTENSPNKDKPILVLAKGAGAYFNHSFIVIGYDYLLGGPRAEDTPEYRAKLQKALHSTVIHELAHFLQFRLFGGWLSRVNYKSSEVMSSDTGGHWFDKETNEGTAWCEGFAEAVAAFLSTDERITEFKFRKIVYYHVRRAREEHRLNRIEGFVAFLLHDFWAPKPDKARLERSFSVCDLSSWKNKEYERHENFRNYLYEHIQNHPEDALRWDLVIRANYLLRRSLKYYGFTFDAGAKELYDRLDRGFNSLKSQYGVDVTAHAIWKVLLTGQEFSTANQVLQAVLNEAKSLAGKETYEIPNSGGDRFETMPISELQEEVNRAKQSFDDWMSQYGYDFHPRVKEAKERWLKLKAILDRRSK